MIVFMRCVAEAVAAKGFRGLAEWMPGVGPYLYDVAADALRRLKERWRDDQLRQELLKAAKATFEEAKAAAERSPARWPAPRSRRNGRH